MNKILNYFNKENQQLKLLEELDELTESIHAYLQKPCKDTFKYMLAELVDVFVLIFQMGLTEGYSKLQLYIIFHNIKRYKIKRTHKVIRECKRTGKSYDEIRY